ncbi:MAG TPA: hypothetical protein DDZ81_05340 [Acetobacteraceae bacterium]|nr:hypothetical protein [Acetobacteraceae bacterium]
MQEQIQIFAPWRDEFRSSFRRHGKKNPVETRADQTSFQSAASVDRFNRLASCCIIPVLGDCEPDGPDEAM